MLEVVYIHGAALPRLALLYFLTVIIAFCMTLFTLIKAACYQGQSFVHTQ
jgi:hypothetical protein